jgi:hypothetical protein
VAPNPDEGPKFTVTYRKPTRAPLDALLQSLYQLSESESCRLVHSESTVTVSTSRGAEALQCDSS